ncbi:MAG: C39 family peptidase [Oscillospiraceae bacterium]
MEQSDKKESTAAQPSEETSGRARALCKKWWLPVLVGATVLGLAASLGFLGGALFEGMALVAPRVETAQPAGTEEPAEQPGEVPQQPNSAAVETEKPEEEPVEARVAAALEATGAALEWSLVHEALDEATLEALLGSNTALPAWQPMEQLGSCSLMVWGLLDGADAWLPQDTHPAGIGGQDLYSVVGMALDGQHVELLNAERMPFSVPKDFFFSRVRQVGFYIRVDAAKMDVPYLSQIDYGLWRGCEATAMTMMISYALGLNGDDVLDPREVADGMAYSPDGDPANGYVGSPYSNGWTTYVPPQLPFVESYVGSAVDLTNTVNPDTPIAQWGGNRSSLARIRATLAQGVPVVVWFRGYDIGGGEATSITHALTLTGYDASGFTLNDPWAFDEAASYQHLHFASADIYQWQAQHDFRAMAY